MNKSILIVTDFYNPHKSGIITYINQLVLALKLKHIKITVLTTKHNNQDDDEEILNGIKIIRCKPFIRVSRGFYSIDLILKFIKISESFDIINVHLPLAEIFPLVFFINKKKTIINYHCLPSFPMILNFLKIYFYLFGIFTILKSKKVIVLSEDYFKNIYLHHYFSNKCIEIPPYITPSSTQLKKNINKKNFKLGYLGRLSNEKGLEYLIDVSNSFQNKNINHEIIIAGNDKDTRFKEYIKFLKFKSLGNNNIRFIGEVNEKQKQEFFNQIDIFLLPSVNSFEAFGIVQLEAMSYGNPVLASNLFGVRSIITKTKNGYLFKSKDVDDLYDKILLCIEKPFNSSEVIKKVKKYYSKEKFKENINNIF